MRHLLTARYTPGCPKLQVDGFLSVETAQVNCLSIDGPEHHPRSWRADKIVPGGFGPLLTRHLSVCRSADQYGEKPAEKWQPHCEPHRRSSADTARVTGVPLSLTMNTRNF